MPSNLLGAFCCNQHLFRVCHEHHRSAGVSVSLAWAAIPTPGQWMARGGGSVFTNYRGEGVMTVMRMRLGLDVTRCSRLTPQWWLHNETPNSQPRPSPVQSVSQLITSEALLWLTLSCHTLCHTHLIAGVWSWSGGATGHDRCPADSLTLPRLTPVPLVTVRAARAAATYAA